MLKLNSETTAVGRGQSMRSTVALPCVLLAFTACLPAAQAKDGESQTYYTRATVGEDHHDGLSPQTAWKTVRRSARDLGPGDTLIIGPGLYREGVELQGHGLADRPLRILGDSSGKWTGDPPGPVVMAGAVPIDESIFQPEGAPGVFKAIFSDFKVVGIVEMDGDQHRYRSVHDPISDIPYVERVRNEKRSFWYDEESHLLYIHTSDEQSPTTHELELFQYFAGFRLVGKPHVWVGGLTFRHYADAGIHFRDGSDYGRAFDNVAFGSRQGFRILRSSHVQIVDNIMFRHENSGAYFLRGSINGLVQGNLSYENAVGLRFSSDSNAGLVIGNTILHNRSGGLSFESIGYAIALHNRFEGNSAQLRLYKSSFRSDHNCFEVSTKHGETLVKSELITYYEGLEPYVAAMGQDLNSREGNCGVGIEKLDVGMLHEQSLSYKDQAVKELAQPGS